MFNMYESPLQMSLAALGFTLAQQRPRADELQFLGYLDSSRSGSLALPLSAFSSHLVLSMFINREQR